MTEKFTFGRLNELLIEIQGNLVFDQYKPLRLRFREFAAYMREHPQNTQQPDFWDKEVPIHIVQRFHRLYEGYLRLKPEGRIQRRTRY